MSELDLSKPVQVLDDDGNWRNVTSPKIDFYVVSCETKTGGRETFYAAPTRLRNTPAPVEEGWRYFKSKGVQYMVNKIGTTKYRTVESNWIQSGLHWTPEQFIASGDFIETDANGNPLATTPPPTRRVPYTVETWPAWAVWVRRKTWEAGVRCAVAEVKNDRICVFGFDAHYGDLCRHYEISGIDGIWHAASREVTP